MKFETPDMVAGNIEKIGALFPAAITEMQGEDGQIKKGINFEVLKQLLSRDVVDGDECYEFTWVGKKAAMAEAARPITKTLRPVKEDSRDWDTTQNLYIEGDNLEVLKILQESYLGKVKMIYIDPPYNTGHDFIYRDKFQRSQQEENEKMGMYDEEENQMFENTESNGRFHSDWCSMMYSRLSLSRNLLTEDGVIFISIDDDEVGNLREVADEVFGATNFVSSIIWEKKYSPANDAKWLSDNHDYILLYAKNKQLWHPQLLPRSDEMNSRYTNRDNDPRGPWKSADMTVKSYSASYDYPITTPSGRIITPAQGRCWNTSKENFEKLVEDNRIWFGETGDNVPAVKKFLSEVQDGTVPLTIWKYSDVGHNQEGRQEVKKLFDNQGLFDGPKPVRLLSRMLRISNLKPDSIILDFFSGSATTAHAVMQLNAEDGGHRKFIMVQLPEPCDEKSEAFKAGYKNICEIGKERIRRAGDKIQQARLENISTIQHEWDQTTYYVEHQEECDKLGKLPDEYYEKKFPAIDTGFRVFRVDSSNMKDVYYQPDELDQQSMFDLVSNIKDDRTDMDLLYACLLDWGVEIHLPHTSTDLDGCTVHDVDNGALMACFSPNVPRSVVEYMAKQQPLRAVFRDSAFASDDAKINVTEIFKNLSPDTKVKVI